jgi:hypothetical protein
VSIISIKGKTKNSIHNVKKDTIPITILSPSYEQLKVENVHEECNMDGIISIRRYNQLLGI